MAKAKQQQSQTPDETARKSEKPYASLPLFYRAPVMLEAARHGAAGVVATNDMAFAKHTNSLPLNAIEFVEAVRHYPIVFTQGENPMPVAVVGLEQDNYFITSDQAWQADCYVPAYARQYPFIFFERPEDERFYLCIDEAAPHFRAVAGADAEPLFAEGKAALIAQRALEFCTAYYQHYAMTQQLCKALAAHKLLMPYQSSATLPSGHKIELTGFQMIDETALNALDDSVFLEFRKNGWLAFIYLALTSSINWKRLVAMAPAA